MGEGNFQTHDTVLDYYSFRILNEKENNGPKDGRLHKITRGK